MQSIDPIAEVVAMFLKDGTAFVYGVIARAGDSDIALHQLNGHAAITQQLEPVDPAEILFGINPPAVVAALNELEQPDLFIIAQGMRAYVHFLRGFLNGVSLFYQSGFHNFLISYG